MPKFQKLSDEEVSALKRRQNGEILKPYREAFTKLGVGWLSITLENGDTKRTVKRRASIAAHDIGLNLSWRRAQAEGVLIAVLADA